MMRFADDKFVSNPGSSIHVVYGPKVRADGSVDLEPVGKENLDDFIQSFAQSTDISFILAKLAAGDDSGLRQRMGTYGDFLNVPGNFAELLQLQIDAGRAFDSLPLDVKSKFNNDVNQFLASAGSESWLSNLGDLVPVSLAQPVTVSESEDVKE